MFKSWYITSLSDRENFTLFSIVSLYFDTNLTITYKDIANPGCDITSCFKYILI